MVDNCVARGSRFSYAALGMLNDPKKTHVNGVKNWSVVVIGHPDEPIDLKSNGKRSLSSIVEQGD